MKGLLLAGGYGTRLRPLTFTGNKHLLPIANKPMILYGLEHLINAGITEIAVILGPIREGVIELIGDGSRFGTKVTYIDQPEPRGLAHAVMISEHFLKGEPFVMYLGDNLLKRGAKPFVEVFEKKQANCVIAFARVKDPSRYGVVVLNRDGSIQKLVEKPREPISDKALVGIYVFDDKIFDSVRQIKPSWRGELEITDAIHTLLNQGARIEIQSVQGWWKDTGRPEDLLEANQLVLRDLEPLNEGTIEHNATVEGDVQIGKNTIVHGRTTVRGPSIIGENCEIGPNAYVGPYTSIGNNSTIKDSEIENSIVMDGVHIECGKRIIDSLIGGKVRVVSFESNVPKGVKLILGDMTYVSI